MVKTDYISNMGFGVYQLAANINPCKEIALGNLGGGVHYFSNITYDQASYLEDFSKAYEERRKREAQELEDLKKKYPLGSYIIHKGMAHLGRMKVVSYSSYGICGRSDAGFGIMYIQPKDAESVPDYSLGELL